MRLLVFVVLFGGTLGIFEAVTLWNDGERMWARLVFALSAGAYIGIALWYYRDKPQQGRRTR